ncbi:MAG: hypothetical protein MJ252_16340, partial [archaeon]|nr:hypothetical protein [archaeon]
IYYPASNTTWAGIENENLIHKEIIKQNKKEYDALKEKMLKMEDDYLKQIHEKNKEYFRETEMYKTQQANTAEKVKEATYAFNLCNNQADAIIDLDKRMEDLKKAHEEEKKEIEIQHQKDFEKLNKKMMDHIQTSQKRLKQSNLENLDLNSKLSRLFTNQLLMELEEQSVQIEDLLKQNEKYKKQIFELKTDLNLHQKVENILGEKNQQYLKMIKNIDKKMEQIKTNNSHLPTETNKFNHTETSNFKKNLNLETIPAEEQNKTQYRRTNPNFLPENLLVERTKEVNNLKDKLNFFKKKEKYFQNKFLDIINIYQTAIDDIIADPEFQDVKLVNADITKIKEEISKGNFAGLNKAEQYSVLIFLVKHLLPLINCMDPGDVEIEEKINGYKSKFDSVEMSNSGSMGSRFGSTCGSDGGFFKKPMLKKNVNYNNMWKGMTNKPKLPSPNKILFEKDKNRKGMPLISRFLTMK